MKFVECEDCKMVIIDRRKVATEWDGGWFCDRCYNLQHWKKKANINQKNEKICDKCLDKLKKSMI